ncbi:hypothetical protein QFC22_005070 [Naganishia vaughanmartiniae]|uniref:Uncharacterized protein n=1 Tax=Naganishia vaughanmartiniae TaxID=1424756 RepID=A0ACC2WWA1_9TREE|nr:hypothetical protein QFC22_005070 [Naganishia vaughanmartiniae]
MSSSAQPIFRPVTPTLILSRPPRSAALSEKVPTADDTVIINYPPPPRIIRPETPECVRERPKEPIVSWRQVLTITPSPMHRIDPISRSLNREWRAQPSTAAMRKSSYDQQLVQSQRQQDCDAASLYVGPATDVDDFDDCWTSIREGTVLFGHDGLYVDPAFLFINRHNPPTTVLCTEPFEQVEPEVPLQPTHLQYKGKTFHLSGFEEEGYEGGCESIFPPGSRSSLTALDEEDADGDTDDLWDSSSIISPNMGSSAMTTPEMSFSSGLAMHFGTTPEDEVDVQLGTPGLSSSAMFEAGGNIIGLGFHGEPPKELSGDQAVGDADSDDEIYPGFPLSSLSPFDRRT